MRVQANGWNRSLIAAMVLACPCLLLALGHSAAQDKGEKKPTPPKMEKIVFVIPDGQPWGQVLDWLRDLTGLPILGSHRPTGTFRLPAAYEQPTSISEVIDLLNDGLVEQKYVILRRAASIMVWPFDEPVPFELANLYDVTFLQHLGRSEFASVQVQTSRLPADKLVSFTKPLLGPLGQIALSDGGKKVTLLDTVANLRKATKLLLDFDANNTRSSVPNDSWKSALDWLSKRTNLPFVGKVMPTKPLASAWPDGDRLVQTPEIVDLLNDALAEQKLLIIRGERAIHVVWTDEPIDPALVPQVRLAELDERGKTEVVSIRVALKRISTPDALANVKPMLSRFGRVEQVGESELVLQDAAGNLQAILSKLRQLGSGPVR